MRYVRGPSSVRMPAPAGGTIYGRPYAIGHLIGVAKETRAAGDICGFDIAGQFAGAPKLMTDVWAPGDRLIYEPAHAHFRKLTDTARGPHYGSLTIPHGAVTRGTVIVAATWTFTAAGSPLSAVVGRLYSAAVGRLPPDDITIGMWFEAAINGVVYHRLPMLWPPSGIHDQNAAGIHVSELKVAADRAIQMIATINEASDAPAVWLEAAGTGLGPHPADLKIEVYGLLAGTSGHGAAFAAEAAADTDSEGEVILLPS